MADIGPRPQSPGPGDGFERRVAMAGNLPAALLEYLDGKSFHASVDIASTTETVYDLGGIDQMNLYD